MIESIVELEANRCTRADVHCLRGSGLRAIATHGLSSNAFDRGVVEWLADGRVCPRSASNECCPDVCERSVVRLYNMNAERELYSELMLRARAPQYWRWKEASWQLGE